MTCEACISHSRALRRILKLLASFHARARIHTTYPRDQADRSRAPSAMKFGSSLGALLLYLGGGIVMRLKRAVLLLASSAMIVPATAQQGQPNPNQVAGKAILQAADAAIGASKVHSYVASSTGWRGYPGQQFAQGDLPRTDLKSNVSSVDFDGKSAKTEYVRVQGNNIPRGGGAGFPVQGEQPFAEFVNSDIAWNLNPQG